MRCFLSHASIHRDHAQFLKDKILSLYPENTDIFLASDPSSLPPGRKWYTTIVESLKQVDVLLVLLAPSFAERPWIMFEAGVAVAFDITVIPLRYAGLTADLIPEPLMSNQSVGLTQHNEVAQMLLTLASARSPSEARLREITKSTTKYFARIETEEVSSPDAGFPVLPLIERIQLLNLASPTQRNLFFHVRDRSSPEGVLESEIREALPIKYNRHGEEGDPDLLISPSEYYFRLRELYLLGLVDMEKVSFHENRWWVRDEIRMALYKTPFWGAPRIGSKLKDSERRG